MYPIKIKLIRQRNVPPNPDAHKDNEELYQYHLMCLQEQIDVIEDYHEDGFILDLVRTVQSVGDQANLDGLFCTDLNGKCFVVRPESVIVDVDCIKVLHRKQFKDGQ